MVITKDAVVSIHFKLSNAENGDLIESTEGVSPMAYLHGANNLIPALEEALDGKSVGDAINITIAPENAYGLHNPDGIQTIPLEALQGIDKIEVGIILTAETPQGPANLLITEVGETEVTVDANHPLAGISLAFEVSVDSIRDATEEELQHGHAHGAGGHHH